MNQALARLEWNFNRQARYRSIKGVQHREVSVARAVAGHCRGGQLE